MKHIVLLLFFASMFFTSHAQNEESKIETNEDSSFFQWDKITWDETINLFYEPGYITTAGGLGNIEPLLFEANIVPYYPIGFDAIAKWVILISPQVILRMFNSYSYPVRTPSYKPRVSLAHQSSKHTKPYHDWFQYISWFHHSNGQDGYFYTDSTNTTINTFDGSFSTNWLEAGIFASRAHSSRQYYAKLYGQYCYLQDSMLNGIYGRWRLHFDLKFEWNIARTLSNLNFSFFENKETILSNVLKIGVICGKIENYKSIEFRRCILDYTISFKPGFLEDVTIFAQYYWGEDYYNIYFKRILQVLRIGISAQNRFFVKK